MVVWLSQWAQTSSHSLLMAKPARRRYIENPSFIHLLELGQVLKRLLLVTSPVVCTQSAFATEHTGGIYCASWSPDGTQVLTASGDKTCKIWDVETGKSVVYVLIR